MYYALKKAFINIYIEDYTISRNLLQDLFAVARRAQKHTQALKVTNSGSIGIE